MKRIIAAAVAAVLVLFGAGTVAVSSRRHPPPRPRPTTTVIVTTTTVVAGNVPADMLNPDVTQATMTSTICVRGWTTTIRPPQTFTAPLKVHQIGTYGYADTSTASYEEDHAIALEVGGAPHSAANLWPEPYAVAGPDDQLENQTKADVCAGRMTLQAGQEQVYRAKLAHGYDRTRSTS